MKLTVILEPGEDGYVVVNCPAIPGCWSQGKTEDEAIENIKEAIRLCLAVRLQDGLPPTVSTREVEVQVWCLLFPRCRGGRRCALSSVRDGRQSEERAATSCSQSLTTGHLYQSPTIGSLTEDFFGI